MSTIVALSTPVGGAIAMVRVSGAEALNVVRTIFRRELPPRMATFGRIISPVSGRVVDEVVCTYFAAPHSYTGEDMVEISCHGSRWVVDDILMLLINNGAVQAQAGEFTQRAFLNGKMNLVQAEAVADLISSSSRAAANVALSQMRSGYVVELSTLRDKLLKVSSLLELELDFAEEDVNFASRDDLVKFLQDIESKCKALMLSFSLGNVIKNGIPVAIVGLPNVGKSTLLNALVGDERAIVSDIAGTTRDYIEEQVNVGGVLFRFIDTAGLRSSEDKIEMMGIERSYDKMRQATIIIQLTDTDTPFENLPVDDHQKVIRVINKVDLVSDFSTTSPDVVCIAAKYGDGISQLRERLLFESGAGHYSDDMVLVTSVRHYNALSEVVGSVDMALGAVRDGHYADQVVASLSSALTYLGEITGEITSDEILTTIFSKFCIGK